jgi:hypothetical protein
LGLAEGLGSAPMTCGRALASACSTMAVSFTSSARSAPADPAEVVPVAAVPAAAASRSAEARGGGRLARDDDLEAWDMYDDREVTQETEGGSETPGVAAGERGRPAGGRGARWGQREGRRGLWGRRGRSWVALRACGALKE